MAMRRDTALELLKGFVEEDDIVVAVYQALFDWLEICPRDLNYVATGAMGQASSHGLGLALANPCRRVLVFDGDGSLLMNLGSLASVADAAPGNSLSLCVRERNLRGERFTSHSGGGHDQLFGDGSGCRLPSVGKVGHQG